jgi:predicted metal-binding membrane protein
VYGVAFAAALLVLAGPAATRRSPSLALAWGGWMLMVAAMMLPVIAPAVRQVALRSLWRRQHRAMAAFVGGYMGIWAVAGLIVVGTMFALDLAHPPAALTVAALLTAAIWQTSVHRRRALIRCGTPRLGAPNGIAADRDCALAGTKIGLFCTVTCGPVMLAMALGHHYPGLMFGLTALLLSERRRGPNPDRRAGRPFEAWCLAGFAAILALAFLAGG